jgi:ABC-type multidrug transport system ATPase subunit
LTEHTNILEASGLGKRYRSTWALRECTLAIPAGFVTALVGPNGAGKSTLLNLVDGLLSSHVLTELERVASYLVVLSRGQVRLTGKVADMRRG